MASEIVIRVLTEYDRVGRPTIELPDNSPSVVAVRQILKELRLDG